MYLKDLSPDLILYNGQIYTLEPDHPVVQAIAVKYGRFLALGTTAEIEAIAGSQTQRLDLGGRAVIPGLFDSHAHLLEVGLKLAAVRLDECRSPEEMMERVRERARQTPPGIWIVGMGWNE